MHGLKETTAMTIMTGSMDALMESIQSKSVQGREGTRFWFITRPSVAENLSRLGRSGVRPVGFPSEVCSR
jgi:hypothetical protein